jgi:hypothetical protein
MITVPTAKVMSATVAWALISVPAEIEEAWKRRRIPRSR